MEAIKKQIAMFKKELDEANEKAEENETKAKAASLSVERLNDEVKDLAKKLIQLEKDYVVSKSLLEKNTAELERCETAYTKAEQDRSVMTKKVHELESQIFKKEDQRLAAQFKFTQVSELLDDSKRICKVLEEKSKLDEERVEKLTVELKDVKFLTEDADSKSDEIAKNLHVVEQELEEAEERAKHSEEHIAHSEDELSVVRNIFKSLEVSEEHANARIEQMKNQLKELKAHLKANEKRAISNEKLARRLSKEVDRMEDELREEKEKYKALCDDIDLTFSEMTGY